MSTAVHVPVVVPADSWLATPTVFSGSWEGGPSGGGVSIIAGTFAPGEGVSSHQHPYQEIFVVRSGRVEFTVGDARLSATAGEIVVAPRDVPHAFVNPGPASLEMLDIHENERFDTTWLS